MKRNIISIVMIAIAIILVSASACYAATITIPNGTSTDAFNGIGSQIIGLVQAAGIIVAVVMLIVVGIKYLTSSPEGKAQYKGTMVAYIVGAILIFAASTIVRLVYDWSTKINDSASPTNP